MCTQPLETCSYSTISTAGFYLYLTHTSQQSSRCGHIVSFSLQMRVACLFRLKSSVSLGWMVSQALCLWNFFMSKTNICTYPIHPSTQQPTTNTLQEDVLFRTQVGTHIHAFTKYASPTQSTYMHLSLYKELEIKQGWTNQPLGVRGYRYRKNKKLCSYYFLYAAPCSVGSLSQRQSHTPYRPPEWLLGRKYLRSLGNQSLDSRHRFTVCTIILRSPLRSRMGFPRHRSGAVWLKS